MQIHVQNLRCKYLCSVCKYIFMLMECGGRSWESVTARGGGDIIYWGIILGWRGGWIDSLQSTMCTLSSKYKCNTNLNTMTYRCTAKTTRLLESKYKMAEVTGPKYCVYNSSKLCSAEGSEVDTLFVFLWHPMHENDLKSRPWSASSSPSNLGHMKWKTEKKIGYFMYAVIRKYVKGCKIFLNISAKAQKVLLWVLNWFGSLLLTDVSTHAECADIPTPIHFNTLRIQCNSVQWDVEGSTYQALPRRTPMSSWNCL